MILGLFFQDAAIMATEIQSIHTRGLEEFFFSLVVRLAFEYYTYKSTKIQKSVCLSDRARSLTQFKLTVN